MPHCSVEALGGCKASKPGCEQRCWEAACTWALRMLSAFEEPGCLGPLRSLEVGIGVLCFWEVVIH